jgi:hypothetical protein
MLAHGAVHGAFAGYTGITVGLVNTHVSPAVLVGWVDLHLCRNTWLLLGFVLLAL